MAGKTASLAPWQGQQGPGFFQNRTQVSFQHGKLGSGAAQGGGDPPSQAVAQGGDFGG